MTIGLFVGSREAGGLNVSVRSMQSGAGCIEEQGGFVTGKKSRCRQGVRMEFYVNAVSVPLHPEQCTLPYQLGLAVP